MEGAARNAQNQFAKNKYATLESVLQSIAEPLSEAGLVLSQGSGSVVFNETARILVMPVWTRLDHAESGQWIHMSIEMPIEKLTPHAIGSAITYGRRYGAKSLLAIPEVDDDGEAAMGRGDDAPKKKSAYAAKKDGGDKVFNSIKAMIEQAPNMEALKEVIDQNKSAMDGLPEGWVNMLRDEYETRAIALKSQ